MAPIDLVTNATNTLITNLEEFQASHDTALCALGLAFGIIICFTGRSAIRPLLFCIGCFPTALFVTYVILAIFEQESQFVINVSHPTPLLVVAMVFGLVCGIGVGWIALRISFSLIIFILAFLFGTIIAGCIHLTITQVFFKSVPDLIFYGFIIFVALLMGFFSLTYIPTMLMLSTAFDGSFMALYFFGQFLGGFPNVAHVNGQFQADEYFHALGYTAMIVALGFIGFQNQWRVAVANGVFVDHRKSHYREGDHDDEREPLLGDAERGQLKAKGADSEYGTPRQFTSPRMIGGAPLYESSENDEKK